jgi:hypothetical protein
VNFWLNRKGSGSVRTKFLGACCANAGLARKTQGKNFRFLFFSPRNFFPVPSFMMTPNKRLLFPTESTVKKFFDYSDPQDLLLASITLSDPYTLLFNAQFTFCLTSHANSMAQILDVLDLLYPFQLRLTQQPK